MQLEEDRLLTTTSQTPPASLSGLFKHPHQFYDDDPWMQNTGEDLELEPHFLDITVQPTLKMARIASSISLDNLSSYDDLDDQLVPDLETHRMNNLELMQISGLL